MKYAQIVHNPTAGCGLHNKKFIINLMMSYDYSVAYISTKDEDAWRKFSPKPGIKLFIAGGDGTVTKVMNRILEIEKDKRPEIEILPLGTANNIYHSLRLNRLQERNKNDTNFDFGIINGHATKLNFFEGMGLGIFPHLIQEMQKAPEKFHATKDKINYALQSMIDLVGRFEGVQLNIVTDSGTFQGNFMLVEVMNIHFLGPQIPIPSEGNTRDGFLDLLMITIDHRSFFVDYLKKLLNGSTTKSDLSLFSTFCKVSKVNISFENELIHIDDEIFYSESRQNLELKLENKGLKVFPTDLEEFRC
ncbi:diacylglycerol kinase family protein [Cytophaga sp. FL35]|uniref:diacylglycerol/lipid kinase family protein n=1 Tax=Cytophaga sp. FL35 TaxID=1904456 RepID=UPI001653CC79|nr:diacylglycerol kinase family protein [Cytophaga sp. FL35]MBC7000820.1 hypothetical protein [Cytophaga sp. FL35]